MSCGAPTLRPASSAQPIYSPSLSSSHPHTGPRHLPAL
jgi:hypothetical protein